jgi:hypothetical protein
MPLFDGPLENRPVDPSEELAKQHNHFFMAQTLEAFEPPPPPGRSGGGDSRSSSGFPTIR